MTLVIRFMIKSILQFKGKSLLCSKVGRSCYNTTARGQAGCPEVMKLGNWQNGLFDSDLSVSYIASHNITLPLFLYLYLYFDQNVTWVVKRKTWHYIVFAHRAYTRRPIVPNEHCTRLAKILRRERPSVFANKIDDLLDIEGSSPLPPNFLGEGAWKKKVKKTNKC